MTPAFSPLTANYSLQLPNSSVFAVTFTDTYPMQTGEITFTADGRAFQSRLPVKDAASYL